MSAPKPEACDICGGSGRIGTRECDNCIGVGVDPVYWHAHIMWLTAQLAEASRQLTAKP